MTDCYELSNLQSCSLNYSCPSNAKHLPVMQDYNQRFIHTHYLQIIMLSHLKPWQQALQSTNALKQLHVQLIKIHLHPH